MHFINDEKRLIIMGVGDLGFAEKADFALAIHRELTGLFKSRGKAQPKIKLQLACEEEDFRVKDLEEPEYLDSTYEPENNLRISKEDLDEFFKDENGFIFEFDSEDQCEIATKIFEQAFDTSSKKVDPETLEELEDVFEEWWETKDGKRAIPGGSQIEEAAAAIKDVVGNRRFKTSEELRLFLIKEGYEDEDEADEGEIEKIWKVLNKKKA